MIARKDIDDIIKLIVGAAVILCLILVLAVPELIRDVDAGISMEYEDRIFDKSEPAVIDIRMDADEWQSMLDTSTQEVYHRCDVVINGTTFKNVGIRPKGNTSLSSIAMNPDTDRFSFKIEFDQYVDGQTAWGLDKLCLNNNYADATNMKEALIYDMYAFLGADAPLYNNAAIYVNGEYWGVYLALEAIEDSFMLRNFGVTNGELYKPDSMGIGSFGDEDRDFFRRDGSEEPESTETPVSTAEPDPVPPEGNFSGSMQELVQETENETGASGEASAGIEFPDFDFGGGPFGNSGGQNLNYTDDDLESYSTIWKSEVTKTDAADHERVVAALKNISEGEKLEESVDIDNLLRLMAVHNFSVNGDSLSGGMAHNYYLYESGGRLNIIPWDYNLSLGGMGMGGSDAESVVNEPIDDPWQSTTFFDPLLENEEYLAKYHEYYRQLVEGYIFGGEFDEFYERTRTQIDELVAADPNALYDYDEYDAGAETLYQLVKLRGQSILGQLNGTIPSTSGGQRQDDSALIEAENIDLSVMGSMSMGGSFGGGGGFPGGFNPFRASGEASGEASEEAGESAALGESDNGSSAEPETASTSGETSDEIQETVEPTEREFPFASDEMQSQRISSETVWMLAACGVVLAAGIVFAVRFRKKG